MIEKLQLTETELNSNYEEFLNIIKTRFTGDRKKSILNLYSEDKLGLTLCTAPASISEHFHFAIAGGYLLHVCHVLDFAQKVEEMLRSAGTEIDYTEEERNFAALHHDLGKLGDPELGDYYVPQDQDWKSRKGEFYMLNPDIQYMDATDRAVYVLQQQGIKISWKEFLGIKLSDGMYKESNKGYLNTFAKEYHLKTELPRIIHVADYMSCVLEKSLVKQWSNG
jgi:hypothetical protein